MTNRMENIDAPLDGAWLQARLAGYTVGHTVIGLATVDSTMTVAAELARDPTMRSGTVVVAEEQRAGRGRRGRSWHAAPGRALLVSFVLKPPHLKLPPTHVPMAAGVALLEAVTAVVPQTAARCLLKWPNDLLIGAEPARAEKVAGLLAESVWHGDGTPAALVLGIGVNVNQTRDELPPGVAAGSLRLAAGHPVDRALLLEHLCRRLAVWLDAAPEAVQAGWRARLATLGQAVAVYDNGPGAAPSLRGRAVDVGDDGALVVMDAAGRLHHIYAADVTLRAEPAADGA